MLLCTFLNVFNRGGGVLRFRLSRHLPEQVAIAQKL